MRITASIPSTLPLLSHTNVHDEAPLQLNTMQIVASLIHALPANERRCFDRKEAASYLGVSPAHLDKLVKNGLAPQPIGFLGRKVWDKAVLDRLLDSLSGIAGSYGDNDHLDRELAEFEAKHGHA
ncbi:helix-turn-helix transcriptional regulator [Mesorhizobium sp. ORM16]|uniref:helix-turn-helix transcriptional regulator n=1 Tax=Mesorhizobium sp. ORM16 TaxID=3376989 RepID=UPI003857DE81